MRQGPIAPHWRTVPVVLIRHLMNRICRHVCTAALGTASALCLIACDRGEITAPVEPPGDKKGTSTQALERAAELLQNLAPIKQVDMYLNGFHPMKEHPAHAMEAHHYCFAQNEELTQCALFDGSTAGANLVGIEYIISEKLFDGLPPEEKKFWHPHNYEILSGQLLAPGVPASAEKELMRKKMNSYGKTWHVWATGTKEHPGDPLPYGTPSLAWSYNADNEMPEALGIARDKRMGVSIADKTKERAELQSLAHPQKGVNDLAQDFPKRSVPPFIREK